MTRKGSNVESIPLMVNDDEEKPSLLSLNEHTRQRLNVAQLTRLTYSYLRRFIHLLIPSFLSPGYDLKFKQYEPGSTGWLDSLRGTAAFFVFIYHFVVTYIEGAVYVWDPVRHPNLLFLPIFRVIYNGSAMVRIFFVVSGFALTYKPAQLLRQQGNQKPLMKTIASSVLRRYLRLMLPCLGAFCIIHFMRVCGAMDWYEIRHKKNPDILPGHTKKNPAKSNQGLLGQVVIMLKEFWTFAVWKIIFDGKYDFATDNHLWTIPAEYQQSMSLFLTVAMLSNVRRILRVYIVLPWLCGLYFYYKNFDAALFVSGYFLAELHTAMHNVPALPLTRNQTGSLFHATFRSQKVRTIFWCFLTFVALFLLSFPNHDGHKSFGYITLCKMLPKYSYFQKRVALQSYGAILLCLSLLHLPRAQRWLSYPVFQYLGRISFSLYLMHGLMMRTLGHRMVLEGWNLFPKSARTERTFVVILTFFFAIFPLTICVSDLFWRVVEAPSVKFVRWLEGMVIVKEDKEQRSSILVEDIQHGRALN